MEGAPGAAGSPPAGGQAFHACRAATAPPAAPHGPFANPCSLPRPAAPPDDGPRALKRKKTVTWAEDDELELPLGPPGGSGGAPPAGASDAEPVVVLPADGLFDALTADLLQEQGACAGRRVDRV